MLMHLIGQNSVRNNIPISIINMKALAPLAIAAVLATEPINAVVDNVEGTCPCDSSTWTNHGEYIQCVANSIRSMDNLTKRERKTIFVAAAKSDCGKNGEETSEDDGTNEKLCEEISWKKLCNKKWGGICTWDSADSGKCVSNTEGSSPMDGKLCSEITWKKLCKKKWGGICSWNSDSNSCDDADIDVGGEGSSGDGNVKNCGALSEQLCCKKWGGKCSWDGSSCVDANTDSSLCPPKVDTSEDGEDTSEDAKDKQCSDITMEKLCPKKWGGICRWNSISCEANSNIAFIQAVDLEEVTQPVAQKQPNSAYAMAGRKLPFWALMFWCQISVAALN